MPKMARRRGARRSPLNTLSCLGIRTTCIRRRSNCWNVVLHPSTQKQYAAAVEQLTLGATALVKSMDGSVRQWYMVRKIIARSNPLSGVGLVSVLCNPA